MHKKNATAMSKYLALLAQFEAGAVRFDSGSVRLFLVRCDYFWFGSIISGAVRLFLVRFDYFWFGSIISGAMRDWCDRSTENMVRQ